MVGEIPCMVRHQLNSFDRNFGKEAVAHRLAVGIPGGVAFIGLDFTAPSAGERLLILYGEAKTVAQEELCPLPQRAQPGRMLAETASRDGVPARRGA